MTEPREDPQVTRFELIDSGGRRVVVWDPDVKLTVSLQDEGQTLKVFADGDLSGRWMLPPGMPAPARTDAADKHKHELGAIVEVQVSVKSSGEAGIEVDLVGTCRLVVVGHIRGPAQEPLYVLSDIPVVYPLDRVGITQENAEYKAHATLVELGYEEDDLRPTGQALSLHRSIYRWLKAQSENGPTV